MTKLSIIVPVYNVQDYIEECIQSLLKQTLDDFEIIVVDDGATDDSIKRISHLKSPKLRIIRRENGGLSAARNTGLKNAKGEFIAFVDSDDYIILPNAYEEMYNLAKKTQSDVVYGNALKYFSDENKFPLNHQIQSNSKEVLTSDEFLFEVLKHKETFAPVWLYLYKRNLLVENMLMFKKGIYHEDEQFTPRVLTKANQVAIYHKVFYFYRQRVGSIVNSKLNIKMGYDVLQTCKELAPQLDLIQNKQIRKLYLNYLAALSIEQIYKYKMYDISQEYKKFILRYSSEIGSKIRAILINANVRLYLILEEKFRSR
ncbi:MAG: glycosyltransferase [Turicibacter sp.]|nr:glycosyltransferase [Turicibacter sp.]